MRTRQRVYNGMVATLTKLTASHFCIQSFKHIDFIVKTSNARSVFVRTNVSRNEKQEL